MTHSQALVTRQLLINLGAGSDVDGEGQPEGEWPIYDNTEPSLPDNCITVYDTNGVDDGRSNPDGEPQGADGILVRIRAKTKLIGWAKAEAIRILMYSRTGGTYRASVKVDETWYIVHAYSLVSSVIQIGKESPTSTRKIFVINCVVNITQCP